MAKCKSHTRSFHRSFFESLLYVIASVVVAVILVRLPLFHSLIAMLGSFGYIGAFFGGMLFVSVFTAAPGAALLITLHDNLPILPLSLIAGLGAVCGDYFIMSVISHEAKQGVKALPNKDGILQAIKRLHHSKYRLLLMILGGIIVASPIPDEIGLSLMGLSHMKRSYFFFLTFMLDVVGIYIMLSIL